MSSRWRSSISLAVGLSVRAADVKAAADQEDAGEEDEDSGRLRRISGGSAGSLDEDDGEEEGEEEEEEEPEVVLVGADSRDESPPGASREGGAAESRADVAVRRSITQWSDDSTKHEWDRFSRTRRMAKVAEEKQQPPMDRSVSFKQKSPTSNDRLQTVMERSSSFPSLDSLDGEINMKPPEAAPTSSSVLELAAADAVAAVDGSRSSRRSFSSGDWSDDQQKSSLPSYLDEDHEETSPIILKKPLTPTPRRRLHGFSIPPAPAEEPPAAAAVKADAGEPVSHLSLELCTLATEEPKSEGETQAVAQKPKQIKPKLPCRICEQTVELSKMSEHSRSCMTDVVVFHVEQALRTLRKHIQSEMGRRRDAALGTSPGGSAAARRDRILSLLERSCADAHLTTSYVTCTSMLAEAQELLQASLRLQDTTVASFAKLLVSNLSQVVPFLQEGQAEGGAAPAPAPPYPPPSSESDAPATAAPMTAPLPIIKEVSWGTTENLGPTPTKRRPSRSRRSSQSISQFEILKPISRGAYGHVVLAAKKSTRDLFAIKVLRKTDMRRKNQVKRIKTERDVLATAEHPYVVKLFYSFHSREHLYLVMEFVNGGDLLSLLKAVGYLEEATARQYIAEIAIALDYLHHTLHVVHRDIKPDNVLIHQDGHIKLTDFGLSVFGLAADQPVQSPPLTPSASSGPTTDSSVPAVEDEMRAKVGTPDYMAPELLLGSKHGISVDLWALGCVAFELLTGYPPFTGDTVEEVFEHVLEHTTNELIRWPEEEGHLSDDAMDFIRKMLHANPDKRPGLTAGIIEIAQHPLFVGLHWDDLRTRSGTVAFLPELDNDRDTSYFVQPPSKISPMASFSELQSPIVSPTSTPPLNSPGRRFSGSAPLSRMDQPSTPGIARQISVGAGSVADEDGAEEDDRDFMNFSFNNLPSLLQRNLELAATHEAGGVEGEAGKPPPIVTPFSPPAQDESEGDGDSPDLPTIIS